MKKIFMQDVIKVFEDSTVDEILNYNDDLRRRYCKYIYQKNQNFFDKTIVDNNYEELKKVYKDDSFSMDDEILKHQEIKMVKKYLLFNNLKQADVTDLKKLDSVNQVMSSMKNKNFDEELKSNEKSRQEIINFIKTYDEEFYNTYKRVNNVSINSAEEEIKLIQIYEEYLKYQGERNI